MKTLVLRTAVDFVTIWPEISSLRTRCQAESDVLLSVWHFLAETDRTRCSKTVACWRGVELTGLLFVTERRLCNVRTGYAVGGDSSGGGLLLCRTEDENDVVQAGVEALFRDGMHSVRLQYLPSIKTQVEFPGREVACIEGCVPGDRMELGGSLQQFLASLGKNTRRNVRYYTRKTLEEGICFDARVGHDEFIQSRGQLNQAATFAQSKIKMERHDRLVDLHSRGMIAGLRNAPGKLIALLYGFSHGKTFYLLSQWNDPSFEKLSLSLVLRGYTVEHLIATGHEELRFVGGTSLAFGRFCKPQQYCSLIIDRKAGLKARVKQVAARWCLRRAQAGKQIPFRMEKVAGAFLDPSLLPKGVPTGMINYSLNGVSGQEHQP